MKKDYKFFPDKDVLTNEDIEDFEAHVEIMQNRDLKELSHQFNSSCEKDIRGKK